MGGTSPVSRRCPPPSVRLQRARQIDFRPHNPSETTGSTDVRPPLEPLLEPFIDSVQASVQGLEPFDNDGELHLDSRHILL